MDDMQVNLTETNSESVDDILKTNEEWKAAKIEQYEKELSKLKEELKEASEEYVRISDRPHFDISLEEIRQADMKLTKIRIKVLKLEQTIKDFKQCPI